MMFGRGVGLVPIHPVFLSSTQFSSDQIQNGGVNSEGRTIAILACACANDVPVEFTLV